MTEPPYECPTSTTSPFCASMTRLVVATSSANDLSGFCTAVTVNPSSSKIGITFFQLEPSEKAPCTSTIEGLLLFEFIIPVFVPASFSGFNLNSAHGLDQVNLDVDIAAR